MKKEKKKLKNWENKIRNTGHRLTEPRKLILRKLSQFEEPRTAENIYLMVQKENNEIGIATVYRTLELLVKLNLIGKINFGTEKSFYIFSDEETREVPNYLICKKCGRVITNNKCLNSNLKSKIIEEAEKSIFKNCGIKIEGYQIYFTGLCDKCV